MVTNSAGEVIQRTLYKPFGEAIEINLDNRFYLKEFVANRNNYKQMSDEILELLGQYAAFTHVRSIFAQEFENYLSYYDSQIQRFTVDSIDTREELRAYKSIAFRELRDKILTSTFYNGLFSMYRIAYWDRNLSNEQREEYDRVVMRFLELFDNSYEASYSFWRLTSTLTYDVLDQENEVTKVTNRGYTGHEHIKEQNLINMNARLYDPSLGRFLSPDTLIPDPYNTQDFNRYTYVRNNPMIYTDPSGHSSHYGTTCYPSYYSYCYDRMDNVMAGGGVFINSFKTGTSHYGLVWVSFHPATTYSYSTSIGEARFTLWAGETYGFPIWMLDELEEEDFNLESVNPQENDETNDLNSVADDGTDGSGDGSDTDGGVDNNLDEEEDGYNEDDTDIDKIKELAKEANDLLEENNNQDDLANMLKYINDLNKIYEMNNEFNDAKDKYNERYENGEKKRKNTNDKNYYIEQEKNRKNYKDFLDKIKDNRPYTKTFGADV